MALISEDREIRTTRPTPRESSPETEYERYLQSPHWRRRRNQALNEAGWACQRCSARKGLQVHHWSYERLGCERREDLEVLCRACHEGEHFEQDQRQHAGIYMRVVSAALLESRFSSMADLLDAVKTTCSRLRIPYKPDTIAMVVRDLDAKRRGILDAPVKTRVEPSPRKDLRPFSQAESIAILKMLNVKVGFREMPSAAAMSDDAVNAFKSEYVWNRSEAAE